jgi:hypothetical protein
MQNRRNYYRVLHVQPDAPVEIIRTSYRTLMQRLRMHPDLGGDHWNAAIINEAFDTLSHPAKRAAYDRILARSGGRFPRGGAPAAPAPATGALELPAAAAAVSACPFCGTAHSAREVTVGADCVACGSPLYPAIKLGEQSATRRAIDRLPRAMPVQYCVTWPATRQFSGVTEDLSISGMRFTTDLELVRNEHLRIDCEFCSAVGSVRSVLPRRQHARGPVAWTVGVEFLTLRIKHTRGSLISEDV